MTGLENILKHIDEEASKNATKTLNEAREAKNKILADAKIEGEKRCADIAMKSKEEVKILLSRAKSAAELEEKKLLLRSKQEAIEHILMKAMEQLKQLPADQYFEILVTMIKKYAEPLPGEIMFSSEDKKRLPNNFEELINAALADKEGATLKISNNNREINGGFILSYGEVEENCSFEALFLAERENLIDKVGSVLF
ncbi:V-type ATP synthase subunit E [Clostridium sp. Marseille-P299]|uniref:V-type ATP synthase subunit E n=1 Tax=Clostridium sp. Marseille-P299 TaxID=1805477 RepID=UPI0008355AA4|nr:V-type ATP synthase subunit E family protein [Clostridium sp. Marseille-P299]